MPLVFTGNDFKRPDALTPIGKSRKREFAKPKAKAIDDRPKITALPGQRSSYPDTSASSTVDLLGSQYAVVTPDFLTEVIPVIRSLAKSNPDISQAVHNIVSLGNTGHKVFFDRNVKADQVDKMRNHLRNKRKKWAAGQAGIDGLVNKLISQVLISGALSGEWIPNPELTGIMSCALINPETIVFKLSKDKTTYFPYQRVENSIFVNRDRQTMDLIKLNTNTYQYYALNGDGETPYGFPPYMPALPRTASQGKMNENIDFIVDIMGLVGFLEVLIAKPDETDGESEGDYLARLDSLLTQARARILTGLKDGVVSGFIDEHTFKFNSASKEYKSVVDLYKNNELQMGTALKQDPILWGRDYGTSESKITIIFMKMLSELKNVQNIVGTFLEFGYALELRLAGFEFDYLNIQFNRSTITDDLKYQQAEEYKIKNIQTKMVLGVINQDQAADELGYETPAFPKPQVTWDILAGSKGAGNKPEPAKRAVRKGQKNKSDKVARRKSKPNK